MIEKNAGIVSTQPQVYTDLSSLQKINAQGHANKSEALKSIAHQFESMMVQQMMQSMRKANEAFSEGDITSSGEQKFYQDMFDNQLSLSLSQGRGFGIAEALLRQFRGKYADPNAAKNTAEAEHALPNNAVSSTRQQALFVQAAAELPANAVADSDAAFSEAVYQLFQSNTGAVAKPTVSAQPSDTPSLDGTPENFVKALLPAAERIAKKLGIDSRVLLSQAALETGWGQKVLQRSGGASSFNFFNIKAGADWQGPTLTVPTLEYQNGVAVREVASFRAYRSAEESFSDYADLIANNPRYQQALQHGENSAAYVKAIAAAGYATDPRYADKVLAVFNGKEINGAPLQAAAADSERL